MEGESNSGLGDCQSDSIGIACRLKGASSQRESLPAHEVDTSIDTHHGASSHISNQAIILNWQISRRASTRRCRTRLSRHFVKP